MSNLPEAFIFIKSTAIFFLLQVKLTKMKPKITHQNIKLYNTYWNIKFLSYLMMSKYLKIWKKKEMVIVLLRS